MKSVTKEAKAKGKDSGMTVPTMILLLVLSMITNTPGLSAIPLIQNLMIISKSGSKSGSNIVLLLIRMYLRLELKLRVYPCMNMLVDAIAPMTLSVMHA